MNHVPPMGGFVGTNTGFNQMPGVSTGMINNFQPVTPAVAMATTAAPPATGI